jgi:hypothetical protein
LPEEFDRLSDINGGGYDICWVGDEYANVLIDSTIFEDGGTQLPAGLKPNELKYLQELLGAPPKSKVTLELGGLPESYLIAVPLIKKMKDEWGGILVDVQYKLATDRVLNSG